eukprot:symbB.v1.2.001095.t1/scaffold33.1/size517934/47
MHLDRFSAKGALYVKVQCGPTGPFLHVCTTHLQSTYSQDAAQSAQAIRHQQLHSLVEFLEEQTNDHISDKGTACRRWPLLLCGTLNFNGRKGLMDGGHSAEYRAVLQLLRERLGEVRDLLYDVTGCHPVTYADTRLTGQGEVPVERVLTNSSVYNCNSLKRQCLDYMLFFPYQPLNTGDDSHEPVVPATCQIQKFSVDRSKDVGAPVTQLSDHYGVEGSLAIIESPAYLAATRPEQRSRGTDVLGPRSDGYASVASADVTTPQEEPAEVDSMEHAGRKDCEGSEEADAAAPVASKVAELDANPAEFSWLAEHAPDDNATRNLQCDTPKLLEIWALKVLELGCQVSQDVQLQFGGLREVWHLKRTSSVEVATAADFRATGELELNSRRMKMEEGLTNVDLLRPKKLRTVLCTDHPRSVISHSIAINSYAKSAEWEKGLGLLQDLEDKVLQPDIVAFTATINVCEKAGKWQEAMQVLEWLLSSFMEPNVVAFTCALRACAGHGSVKALTLLQTMTAWQVSPNIITYNTAISACGDWQEAIQLLELARSKLKLDTISFNAAISACARVGAWEQAIFLLHEIQTSEIQMNLRTFNAGITAFETTTQWQQSLLLFNQVHAYKLQANIITYTSVLSACGRASSWEHAIGLLTETMVESLQPNLLSYSAAMSACVKAGQAGRALSLLQQAETTLQPDIVMCNAAISACETKAAWQQALLLLHQTELSRLEVTVITYNASISACEKASQWQVALYLMTQLGTKHIQADVVSYNSSISACQKDGLWHRALGLFRILASKTLAPVVTTLNAVISCCERSWLQALHLLSIATKTVGADIISHGASVTACARPQTWHHAIAVLKQVATLGLEANAYTCGAATSACGRASQWLEALAIPNKFPVEVMTGNPRLSACDRAAQWKKALSLCSSFCARLVQLDYNSYSALLSACDGAQKWRITLNLVRGIFLQSLQPSVMAYVSAINAAQVAQEFGQLLFLLGELDKVMTAAAETATAQVPF